MDSQRKKPREQKESVIVNQASPPPTTSGSRTTFATSPISPSRESFSRTSLRCSPTRRPSLTRSTRSRTTTTATRSTRFSGSRRAASWLRLRSRTDSRPVSSRCGRRASFPWEVQSEEYELEYGTDLLEIHGDAIEPGERILIVDDVLATGGTASATARLTERCGGKVAGSRL